MTETCDCANTGNEARNTCQRVIRGRVEPPCDCACHKISSPARLLASIAEMKATMTDQEKADLYVIALGLSTPTCLRRNRRILRRLRNGGNHLVTEPTQQEKCAALARAMFPSAVVDPSATSDGVDIRVYDKPNETRSWPDFNPYESAADSRALVAWLLDEDPDTKFCEIIFLSKLMRNYSYLWQAGKTSFNAGEVRSIISRVLTVPLPVIADAAWQAIRIMDAGATKSLKGD